MMHGQTKIKYHIIYHMCITRHSSENVKTVTSLIVLNLTCRRLVSNFCRWSE